MKGVSHALVGMFAASAVHLAVAPLSQTLAGLVPVAGVVLVASLLPDIDSDESAIRQATGTARHTGCLGWIVSLAVRVFGGHRALTHTLLAWGLLSWIVLVYFHGNMLGVAFSVGYLSHLLADSLTVAGVPWLWPLWGGRIRFLPKAISIRTGGVVEQLTVIALGVAVGLLFAFKFLSLRIG